MGKPKEIAMLIRERKCCGRKRKGSNDMVTNGPMTRRHPVSQEHNTVPRSEGKMLHQVPGEVASSEWIFLFFFGPRGVRQTGQGIKV